MKPASKAQEAQELIAEGQAAGWFGFTYTTSFAFQCVINDFINELIEIDIPRSISFKDGSILVFITNEASKYGFETKIVLLQKTLIIETEVTK